MNQEQDPMNGRQDLASAFRQRERSRSRMRRVTAAAGVASLATAGVVAYNLPGPAHTAAANGTATTPATTQPPGNGGQSGDDGGQSGDDGGQSGDDGGQSADDGGSGAITVPGGASAQAPAHAASGGS
jgi:hypothetical protein